MDSMTASRMRARARRAMFFACLNGAYGHVVQEEDELRGLPRVIERSLYDALYVARNPLGNSPAELALCETARHSRNIRELRVTADIFSGEPPERLMRARKVKVITDFSDSRHLHPKQRFFIERDRGAEQLLANHAITGLTDKRSAEVEWMKRQAEWGTGVQRNETNASRRAVYESAYAAMEQRDFRGRITKPRPA